MCTNSIVCCSMCWNARYDARRRARSYIGCTVARRPRRSAARPAAPHGTRLKHCSTCRCRCATRSRCTLRSLRCAATNRLKHRSRATSATRVIRTRVVYASVAPPRLHLTTTPPSKTMPTPTLPPPPPPPPPPLRMVCPTCCGCHWCDSTTIVNDSHESNFQHRLWFGFFKFFCLFIILLITFIPSTYIYI